MCIRDSHTTSHQRAPERIPTHHRLDAANRHPHGGTTVTFEDTTPVLNPCPQPLVKCCFEPLEARQPKVKVMNMDTEDYIDLLSARAADARAMIMFFAVIHTGLLVVLGFAGSGLEDSGIQLALAAVTVLTSLWTVFFMDDCMQDLFAIAQDLPEDFKASNVGRRFTDVPLPVFRVVNFVVIALIVVAEVLAIY